MGQNINEYGLSSGRMLKEDSVIVNQADYLFNARRADTIQSSRDGNLFRGWFQGTIPGATVQWFALVPPPGLLVYGESRIVTIEAGEIRVQFYVGGTRGNPIGPPLPSRNFNPVDGPSAQSIFQQYDTITDSEANSSNKLLTAPTTGPRTIPSDQTDVGAHVKVSNDKFAAFRIENTTGDPEEITLFITWQELP